MLNPENRPTVRVLPNGRRIGTTKGLLHTPEEGKRISEAKLGKPICPKSRQEVIKKSTTYERVRPLFVRGASVEEIVRLTGIMRTRVKNAIYGKKRPAWHSLNRENLFTEDKKRERLSRALKGKPCRLLDRPPLSEDEKIDLDFAKKIIEAGFIGWDLFLWKDLGAIYQRFGRELPQSFAQRIRLEIFCKGVILVRKGDKSLLNKYIEIGEKIDRAWFDKSLVDEQVFINSNISSGNGNGGGAFLNFPMTP